MVRKILFSILLVLIGFLLGFYLKGVNLFYSSESIVQPVVVPSSQFNADEINKIEDETLEMIEPFYSVIAQVKKVELDHLMIGYDSSKLLSSDEGLSEKKVLTGDIALIEHREPKSIEQINKDHEEYELRFNAFLNENPDDLPGFSTPLAHELRQLNLSNLKQGDWVRVVTSNDIRSNDELIATRIDYLSHPDELELVKLLGRLNRVLPDEEAEYNKRLSELGFELGQVSDAVPIELEAEVLVDDFDEPSDEILEGLNEESLDGNQTENSENFEIED